MEIRVGCCGWSALRPQDFGEHEWQKKYKHRLQLYAAHFSLVEVNSTFYKLPRLSTAAQWRALVDEVNLGFEFTVKVHQDVTHTARFRGETARKSFAKSAEIAQALGAKILLLQCPASFGPTEENRQALHQFLAETKRENFIIVWEPRGAWEKEPQMVKDICEEHEIIHCTDPFRWLPMTEGKMAYLRLHGSPPGEKMYRYTYTDQDLFWLLERIRKLNVPLVYVLFNNDTMANDARRFLALLGD
ncbi:MAG: DUF72 domain-containing protein [Candidatus Bipolaricaulota bacterium]|nr:DUF72 domain-containing protein [Candidatus Bipolaricaulota bacterium]MDW8126535.1 DUF72 domain-containing protein [Candidatus Bipolaricaulota bacterium]